MTKAKLIALVAAAVLAIGGIGGAVPLMSRYIAAPPIPGAGLDSTRTPVTPPAVAPVTASAPALPDATGARAADGAQAALWAMVHALRTNDLVGLHQLAGPQQQAERERAWKQVGSWPWGDAAVADQILALVASEAGQQQMLPLAQALLSHLPVLQWARDAAKRVQVGAGPIPAPATPADEVARAQLQTVQELLTAFSRWLPQAGLNDPGRTTAAVKLLMAGLAGLHVSHSADLAQLDLPEALRRFGQLTAQFKLACAAYGLQIDQVLDSVRIDPSPVPAPDATLRTLSVAFTVFGQLFTVPVTLAERDGRWSVIPSASTGPAHIDRPASRTSSEF